MIYLVTYDLNKLDKNYTGLYAALGQLGTTHKDPDLDSVWFVSTTYSIDQIYEHLKTQIDSNNRLLITRLRPGEYLGWVSSTTVQWLGSLAH